MSYVNCGSNVTSIFQIKQQECVIQRHFARNFRAEFKTAYEVADIKFKSFFLNPTKLKLKERKLRKTIMIINFLSVFDHNINCCTGIWGSAGLQLLCVNRHLVKFTSKQKLIKVH